MNARRNKRNRPSSALVSDRPLEQNKLRAPVPVQNGPVNKSEMSAATTELEARLCELELRLTQSESENRKLREAYRLLEAANTRQSKLQDLATVGLVTLDVRGTILDINLTGAALLGWEKKQLLQRRFAFLLAPEDAEEFLDHLRRCRRGHKETAARRHGAHPGPAGRRVLPHAELRHARSIEVRLRRRAAGPIIVHLASVPVRDQQSRVVTLETTLIDISERKQAEAALQASEKNLR